MAGMAEFKRVDPEDGAAYTYKELAAYYKGQYSKTAIADYWECTCKPVPAKGKGEPKTKAEPKAKAKAKAKAEPKDKDKGKHGDAAKENGRPRRAAVVVDPYSSGKYLLQELRKRKVPIIAVRSSPNLSMQFLRAHKDNSKYWVKLLEFHDYDDVPALAAALKALPYEIAGVFAGSEPGVELSDRIADALDMKFRNPLDLLECRKDKAEMQESLRRAGVPAAEQYKSGDLNALLEWAKKRNEWPLVCKPISGAGSDGVYFCKTLEDIKQAHQATLGAMNATGQVNAELALQEFLAGDEYIVDTVSRDGKHLVIAAWVYTKIRGLPWDANAIIPACSSLLPPNAEKVNKLVEYVLKVLDTVGVRNGPCHTEVMLTQKGPILVEVNCRMHGLQGPRLIELSTGISKATYTADAIMFQGSLFNKLYQEGRPGRYLYPVLKQCYQMVLMSGVQGYLKTSIKDLLQAENLPSIVEILPAVAKGGFINMTRDLGTAPGFVLCVHESEDQIKADMAKIRELETSGKLYEVQEEPLEISKEVPPARSRAATEMSDSSAQTRRTRLDSLENIDQLWSKMNEPVPRKGSGA